MSHTGPPAGLQKVSIHLRRTRCLKLFSLQSSYDSISLHSLSPYLHIPTAKRLSFDKPVNSLSPSPFFHDVRSIPYTHSSRSPLLLPLPSLPPTTPLTNRSFHTFHWPQLCNSPSRCQDMSRRYTSPASLNAFFLHSFLSLHRQPTSYLSSSHLRQFSFLLLSFSCSKQNFHEEKVFLSSCRKLHSNSISSVPSCSRENPPDRSIFSYSTREHRRSFRPLFLSSLSCVLISPGNLLSLPSSPDSLLSLSRARFLCTNETKKEERSIEVIRDGERKKESLLPSPHNTNGRRKRRKVIRIDNPHAIVRKSFQFSQGKEEKEETGEEGFGESARVSSSLSSFRGRTYSVQLEGGNVEKRGMRENREGDSMQRKEAKEGSPERRLKGIDIEMNSIEEQVKEKKNNTTVRAVVNKEDQKKEEDAWYSMERDKKEEREKEEETCSISKSIGLEVQTKKKEAGVQKVKEDRHTLTTIKKPPSSRKNDVSSLNSHNNAMIEEIMKLRKLSVKVVEEGEETIGMRLPIFASRYLIGSYPAALHLLRRKHLFLIKKDTPLTDHLRFLRLQRERPDGWRDVFVEEGDRIYYPHGLDLLHKAKEEIVSNKERESKEGADELNGETKVVDLRKRLLYKDTDFLAIDKPFGLPSKSPLSFSKKRMNKEECSSSSSPISVSSILHQLRFSMDENPSILNVLSSDVTGVLLLGRSKSTSALALDKLRTGNFGKMRFWAIVSGRPPGGKREGIIRLPLGEDQTRGLVLPLAVQRGGSVAITRWKLLKTTGGGGDRGWQGFDVGRGEAKHRLYGFSLLELEIQQPQFRHQIRAHCLYGLSCPIVGDKIYGALASSWRRVTSTGFLSPEDSRLFSPQSPSTLKKERREEEKSRIERLKKKSAVGGLRGGIGKEERGMLQEGRLLRDEGKKTEDVVEGRKTTYEDNLFVKEARQVLGPIAPSMIHLHSRAIAFETFAGHAVCIEAPVPPHMVHAAKRLGWTFSSSRDSSSFSSPYLSHIEEEAFLFSGKDNSNKRNFFSIYDEIQAGRSQEGKTLFSEEEEDDEVYVHWKDDLQANDETDGRSEEIPEGRIRRSKEINENDNRSRRRTMKELLNQDDMSSLKSKVKDRKNHMKHLDRSLESDVFSSSYLFSDDEEEEKEKKEKRVCWITRLKNKK